MHQASIQMSENKDLVKFTTEVCGLNGDRQTVKLTQQEANEVEALFDLIRNKLNNTESREEAEEIFKDAVVELDKYGLLGGLSVKQAQRLVTGGYKTPRISRFIDRISDKIPVDNNSNILCIISGEAEYPGPVCPSVFVIFNLFKLLPWPSILLALLLSCRLIIDFFVPFSFGALSIMGSYDSYDGNYTPSYGYIETFGLNGKKVWDGNLYGQIVWSYPTTGG